MGTAYHWLVAQGLWHAVIVWVVGFGMGTVLRGGIKRAWDRHMRVQHLIADRLDAETPGGLGDLREDLRAETRQRRTERTRARNG